MKVTLNCFCKAFQHTDLETVRAFFQQAGLTVFGEYLISSLCSCRVSVVDPDSAIATLNDALFIGEPVFAAPLCETGGVNVIRILARCPKAWNTATEDDIAHFLSELGIVAGAFTQFVNRTFGAQDIWTFLTPAPLLDEALAALRVARYQGIKISAREFFEKRQSYGSRPVLQNAR